MRLNIKRKLLLISIWIGLIVYFISMITFYGNDTAELIIVISFTLFLITWLILSVTWWRCPHCGKSLRTFRSVNYCHYCGKELDEFYDN